MFTLTERLFSVLSGEERCRRRLRILLCFLLGLFNRSNMLTSKESLLMVWAAWAAKDTRLLVFGIVDIFYQ